ncbi:hypothetical protein BaRGS_00033685 [Batillaria attramentaria]|uniref:Uncharacterized protein n=1 Tax=Batillaria attramentaria TaxID=370345 RepID=A0ABD0JJ90_9CAEN
METGPAQSSSDSSSGKPWLTNFLSSVKAVTVLRTVARWLLSLSTTSSSLATEQVPQADRHATLAVDMVRNCDATLLAFAHFDQGFEDKETLQWMSDNVLVYIAGYIAFKLQDKSVCSACKGSLDGTRTGSSTETFLNTKKYRGIQGGLKMPSSILQRSVKQMEREYEDVVGTLLHTDQVMWRVVCKLSKMNEVVCIEGNRCNVGHLVVQLFASLRLHFTLKDSNRSFPACTEKDQKRNGKMMKISHI